jgi:cyclin T
MPGSHGPEKQNSNQRIPPNESRGGTATSNDGPNMSSSTTDATGDTVEAAPEKRGDSESGAGGKVDAVDDDDNDVIGSELERGAELAVEDEGKTHERTQTLPNSPDRKHHQNGAGTTVDAEEGELSVDSQEHLKSLEADNRKRKDTLEEHVSHDDDERELKRPRS